MTIIDIKGPQFGTPEWFRYWERKTKAEIVWALKEECGLSKKLEEELSALTKGVCIYAREEMGNHSFETDDEVINWFKNWGEEE